MNKPPIQFSNLLLALPLSLLVWAVVVFVVLWWGSV